MLCFIVIRVGKTVMTLQALEEIICYLKAHIIAFGASELNLILLIAINKIFQKLKNRAPASERARIIIILLINENMIHVFCHLSPRNGPVMHL